MTTSKPTAPCSRVKSPAVAKAVQSPSKGGVKAKGRPTANALPPAEPSLPADSFPPASGADEPKGKLGTLVRLLSRPQGASVQEMSQATGWQAHSVRGAMSGALKKARNYVIVSDVADAGRLYRITGPEASE